MGQPPCSLRLRWNAYHFQSDCDLGHTHQLTENAAIQAFKHGYQPDVTIVTKITCNNPFEERIRDCNTAIPPFLVVRETRCPLVKALAATENTEWVTYFSLSSAHEQMVKVIEQARVANINSGFKWEQTARHPHPPGAFTMGAPPVNLEGSLPAFPQLYR